ncbi:MAG: DinB family protein [Hyphomicrobiales bacterium]
MPENRDDLLREYRESREKLLAVIDGLDDAALTERSIDGWSVADHLLHLATWDEVRAREVERISAGHISAWRMTEEQDDAFNALSYDLRRNLTPAQARWELESSRQHLMNAIASATERGLDASLYGEAGLRSGHEAQHVEWLRNWRQKRGI